MSSENGEKRQQEGARSPGNSGLDSRASTGPPGGEEAEPGAAERCFRRQESYLGREKIKSLKRYDMVGHKKGESIEGRNEKKTCARNLREKIAK